MTTRKKNGASVAGQPQFTTPKGVAEMLQCAERTVYKKINSGELIAYRFSNKPGSAIRIKVEDVLALMQPVIPEAVMADIRSRQPGPLHRPLPAGGSHVGTS